MADAKSKPATSSAINGWMKTILVILGITALVLFIFFVGRSILSGKNTASTQNEETSQIEETEAFQPPKKCGDPEGSKRACKGSVKVEQDAMSEHVFIYGGYCITWSVEYLQYVDTYTGIPGRMTIFDPGSSTSPTTPDSHYYQFKGKANSGTTDLTFEIKLKDEQGKCPLN